MNDDNDFLNAYDRSGPPRTPQKNSELGPTCGLMVLCFFIYLAVAFVEVLIGSAGTAWEFIRGLVTLEIIVVLLGSFCSIVGKWLSSGFD